MLLKTIQPLLRPESEYLVKCAKPTLLDRLLAGFKSSGESKNQKDVRGGMVENYDVGVNRVALGAERYSEGPILFLDLGEETILTLVGQWLYRPPLNEDGDRMYLDREVDEQGFFKHFILRRTPSSGIVLSLKVTDETIIRSERTIEHRFITYPFGESCVFRGSLDSLEGDLEKWNGGSPKS